MYTNKAADITVKMPGKGAAYVAGTLSESAVVPTVATVRSEIISYVRERWEYTGGENDHPAKDTLKDRKERAVMYARWDKMRVIMAADKNTFFEEVAALVKLADNDEAKFEECYKAAVALNPKLDPEYEAKSQGNTQPEATQEDGQPTSEEQADFLG